MVFGPDDLLYVSSAQTSSVLRFDATTGTFIDEFVTTASGDLDEPIGLTFGPDGNLYVADNQAFGGARHVDGRVAAAVDHDPAAELQRRIAGFHIAQETHGIDDARGAIVVGVYGLAATQNQPERHYRNRSEDTHIRAAS